MNYLVLALMLASPLFASSPVGVKGKLYGYIFSSQINDHENPHESGSWPTEVSARTLDMPHLAGRNLFMPLQISLSLSRTTNHFFLPGLSRINHNLRPQVDRYLLDTTDSNRRAGSVCFWPYQNIYRDVWAHNFAQDKSTYETFDAADLPNDLDTSSRLAMWLMENDPEHPFIEDFVTTSASNTDTNSGGYMTWVHNSDLGPNNVDCVVNMNVLASLSRYQKNHDLSATQIKSNQQACDMINEAVLEDDIPSCSRYYDRKSEILLAYALAAHEGVSCLTPSYLSAKSALEQEATRVLQDRNSPPTEIAEIAQGLNYLTRALGTSYDTSLNLANRLKARLLKHIDHESRTASIEPQSVFIGTFGSDTFDWQSRAYSTALALEALSLPNN